MTHARRKPPHAQRVYGVLVADIIDGKMNPTGASPHYEIWLRAGADDFRVAVNVQSVDGSDVLAHYEPNYKDASGHDLAGLARRPQGFTKLATGPGGAGLDYARDPLFNLNDMHDIPADGAGVTLLNLLDGQIERAKADDKAVALAFGEYFEDRTTDKTFNFSPERGLHDIHFMQGNSDDFADDNRVHGDGALFIRFGDGETIALFVRFDTQSIRTDDQTGAPI
jgi:uncharacterized protein YukJ